MCQPYIESAVHSLMYVCMYVCMYGWMYVCMCPKNSLNGTLAVHSPYQTLAVDYSSNL